MDHCSHFSKLDMPQHSLNDCSSGWIKVHIDCCVTDESPAVWKAQRHKRSNSYWKLLIPFSPKSHVNQHKVKCLGDHSPKNENWWKFLQNLFTLTCMIKPLRHFTKYLLLCSTQVRDTGPIIHLVQFGARCDTSVFRQVRASDEN